MKKKRWTEKQIKKKIEELENHLKYQKRVIARAEEEMRDVKLLIQFYKEKLEEKYNNPSSKKFGGVKDA